MDNKKSKSVSRYYGVVRIDSGDLDEVELGNTDLEITALPAYHETSRMGFDAHQTLALGWSIRRLGGGPSIYFAGDTAYGPVFKQIRQNFGAHEFVFVPIGAYEPREEVRHVHASPEEAAKIAAELGASTAIGMHWGTFPLSDEPVMEPAERFKDHVCTA